MNRTRFPGAVLALLALCAIAPAAAAAGEATWQFAPAEAPPAPPGVVQQPLPVPVGKVGAISFWSPNRGLLIDEGTAGCRTASTGAVPCGLYAYNGRGWHLLSTVCGGGEGRIAWAGPDDFWTISDQRPGQLTKNTVNLKSISLCHFENGTVVASYAKLIGVSDSYLKMDAAACASETDCWFGGALGEPPNTGAFHLHWDGHNLTTVYSPEEHAVSSMAVAGPGRLFESVEINRSAPGDSFGDESEAHPFVLHEIDFGGEFHGVLINDPACAKEASCPPLPNYEGLKPEAIAGFNLSGDYAPAAPNTEPQLWAVAGRPARSTRAEAAHSIVLHYSRGSWSQVLDVKHPGSYDTEAKLREEAEARDDLQAGLREVAAEPGSPAAWVTVGSEDGEAHVDRLTVGGEGDYEGTIQQRDVLGEAQDARQRGEAGPIACPAQNDCWLATSKGWLFHLTEVPGGADEPGRTAGYEPDEDPNFAGVITFRPPDEGVPQIPPNEPPPDNALVNQAEPVVPKANAQATTTRVSKALVTGVSAHIVDRYTLKLSFKLTVRARVQLLASRNGRRVAHTAVRTLTAGKHTLMLRLSPRRWPNHIDLKATPLESLPTVESKSPSSSSPNYVAPPVGSNTTET